MTAWHLRSSRQIPIPCVCGRRQSPWRCRRPRSDAALKDAKKMRRLAEGAMPPRGNNECRACERRHKYHPAADLSVNRPSRKLKLASQQINARPYGHSRPQRGFVAAECAADWAKLSTSKPSHFTAAATLNRQCFVRRRIEAPGK